MKTLLRVAPLAAALCLLPLAASAQVDKQDNELAANASLFAALQGGTPIMSVGVHYGKLLKEFSIGSLKVNGLQVGGDALFSGPIDFSNGGILTLFPAARLYFSPKDPRITPYAGLGLGLSFIKAPDVTVHLAYDLNGGVKYFLNPTTAAFVQLDLTGPLTDPGSSFIIVSAGLSVFF